jgi:cation diffusion facilitator family transporter
MTGVHEQPTGVRGFLHEVFVPHSHDAADSIDDALESTNEGIRAVKLSLVLLGATAVAQAAVVLISGSVALLSDTIHNFSDALTAVPLWIAFAYGRRAATRRYTHGYGRVEDLAGLFVVAMIALSAIVAATESIRRFNAPVTVSHLEWVIAAGIIGFVGNEAVALYRIRVGHRIRSAALVADGVHARTDGFTSLAVVAGAVGVWLGYPLADPVVGLVIAVAIVVLLWGAARSVGGRLLDAVDPSLVDRAEAVLEGIPGVGGVTDLRMRWNGHRLNLDATITIDSRLTIGAFHDVEHVAARTLRTHVPGLGRITLTPEPSGHLHASGVL